MWKQLGTVKKLLIHSKNQTDLGKKTEIIIQINIMSSFNLSLKVSVWDDFHREIAPNCKFLTQIPNFDIIWNCTYKNLFDIWKKKIAYTYTLFLINANF